jgi:hypothetical protein
LRWRKEVWPRRFRKSSAADRYATRALGNALQRRYRKQVASAELIKAVYGARSKHASHSSLVPRPFTRRNFDAGHLLRA